MRDGFRSVGPDAVPPARHGRAAMNGFALVPERFAPPPRRSVSELWLKALQAAARIDAEPSRLFADVIQERAEMHPDRPALIGEDGAWSYGQLAARINRYARAVRALGVGPGDRVGLLMPNRPDYIACWLGIGSLGAAAALLNTSLVGRSLAHCIEAGGLGRLVVARDCLRTLETARRHLARPPAVWSPDLAGDRLHAALTAAGETRLGAAERGDVSIERTALLIYTSGTTGLPKAAKVSHRRVLEWGAWFAAMAEAGEADRLYDCLPLHHSVGGVVAPCSMLHAGGSVAVAARFSASRFWDDVVRLDCTVFQYIGELCRYLLKAPRSETERRHRLRLAVGNGLRGDVWEAFVERFRIPRVLEFYAATEGNFSLFNVEGEPGAVGRVPAFLAHRFPAAVIRIDADGEPVRGADGLCAACATGEAGEAVGRIGVPAEGGGAFLGYVDEAATRRKILRDVFVRGDSWFRTGDLMSVDGRGFFRFVDRIGDTFRWKGENVATGEVEAAILDFPGIADAATYGVSVPGADGRAGMAALVVRPGFDLQNFAEHMAARLPPYAQPLFVRFCKTIDSTATFRRRKARLAEDGFDPAAVRDRLFLRDAAGGYRRLDAEVYGRIVRGEIRF